jgi:hypothetical protein
VRINFKRYALYLLRWQASPPILAGIGIILAGMGYIVAAIIANLIGSLIFFWVDQFIFTSQSLAAQWEVREIITCVDCGKIARGYHLVQSGDYDKSEDAAPEFRCEECSKKKTEALRSKGIKVE